MKKQIKHLNLFDLRNRLYTEMNYYKYWHKRPSRTQDNISHILINVRKLIFQNLVAE